MNFGIIFPAFVRLGRGSFNPLLFPPKTFRPAPSITTESDPGQQHIDHDRTRSGSAAHRSRQNQIRLSSTSITTESDPAQQHIDHDRTRSGSAATEPDPRQQHIDHDRTRSGSAAHRSRQNQIRVSSTSITTESDPCQQQIRDISIDYEKHRSDAKLNLLIPFFENEFGIGPWHELRSNNFARLPAGFIPCSNLSSFSLQKRL